MKELVLDTTLGCKACEAKVQPLLDADPRVIDWEVKDRHILRVVTEGACQKCINKIISEKGYAVKEQLSAKEVDPKDYADKITHEIPKIEYEIPEVTADNAGKYYCPMQCEGELLHDEMGDCSICGMPLEKIPEAKTPVKYACPMHPDIEYDAPGDCPICGMPLEPILTEQDKEEENEALTDMTKRFRLSLFFTLPVAFIAMAGHIFPPLHHEMLGLMSQTSWNAIEFVLTIPMVFYTGWIFMKRAWSSIVSRNFNMWTLIGIGTTVAFIFSTFALFFPGTFPNQFKQNGAVDVYFEATCVILLLVMVGQIMELRAHSQTNSALKSLLNWTPPTATIVKDGKELLVAAEHIKVDDIIRIKPGEKVVVDGVLIDGHGTIDTAMITGEPVPSEVKTGDKVTSGTINTNGSFMMLATKVGKETLLSKIIEMVNDASRSRAPIQKLADQIAKYFVPIVVSVSIITFLLWLFLYNGEDAATYALVNAVAVLLIACPCALGLATPMSIMVGTGKGAQNGILIKNAEALQGLGDVNVLMIDKTGTITEGKPTVFQVISADNYSVNDILNLAASLDKSSDHPIAKAIVLEAKNKGISLIDSSNFSYEIGKGSKGEINEAKIKVGNLKILEGDTDESLILKKVQKEFKQNITTVYVSENNKIIGAIGLTDQIKKESKEAIKSLQEKNIEVIMLTGDNQETAAYVAKQVGITTFKAECLPEDKLKFVEKYQSKGLKVAMAGDGINDAPALTKADIGIAMGNGTDIAIESAEITLLKGDLSNLLKAFKLSSKVMKNIKENLVFAFFYNVLGVPIAAGVLFPFFGILLSPMLATLAMSFSSVSVITNAMRLKRIVL
ncbi:copper-transporting P-type ATPase [Flammeovirga kamogawensis]|uniref:Copper-translocating P-type ATPase n=1 Tax=Flammeovirga kamogawensis TaxID=373891 RepID=A0ABX8GWU6_9BACT|nr:copper-translocating P-type ATPase [Flammeovirga kamogawensis]MBB6461247.1 Cu2+-exporting ATPase [Flammeovirga kamogawensis]QWG07806.1 copper-translocating P-type ATPase [Flammeovirga kamogawensis]TRX69612.1 copper-translocating P-type ATPase [Flammeovirga kamogawensis]